MIGTPDAFFRRYYENNGIVTGKFVMQLGIACAIIQASAKDANANRTSLPPSTSAI